MASATAKRYRRRRRARRIGVLAAVVAMAAGGCGDSTGSSGGGGGGQPEPGGMLAIAMPSLPRTIDPLLATGRSEQLVCRQIFEPLAESLVGPYGDVRRLPGPALSAHPSADATIWRIRLRRGMRFGDGSLLDASAVLENANRWRATAEGRALLPDLVAADAPRPDLVRFILDRPDAGFGRRLASPRLGVVSPRALDGSGIALDRPQRAGSGPFELRQRTAGRVLLVRNTAWWGSARGLGPALDQVEFTADPADASRLRALRDGDVQIADRLAAADAARIERDPLLTDLPGPGGTVLGLQRSVRGIDSATEIPSLSGVWLTRIGAG
jgi:peptide/nickel transport system substrate-binding protein